MIPAWVLVVTLVGIPDNSWLTPAPVAVTMIPMATEHRCEEARKAMLFYARGTKTPVAFALCLRSNDEGSKP